MKRTMTGLMEKGRGKNRKMVTQKRKRNIQNKICLQQIAKNGDLKYTYPLIPKSQKVIVYFMRKTIICCPVLIFILPRFYSIILGVLKKTGNLLSSVSKF